MIGALTLIMALNAPLLGAESPEWIHPSAVVGWDHDGMDVEGNPDNLAEFEIAAFNIDTDEILKAIKVPACQSSGAMTCESAITSLELGDGPCVLRVRAYDAAGNVSGWSNALVGTVDGNPPKAPSFFRATITVTVTVGG